jgi:autotransporter strand-loop-strand O-heptosyltransferase
MPHRARAFIADLGRATPSIRSSLSSRQGQLISGFTHPTNEFDTPYQVINYHASNSCWNDVRRRFDHKDLMYRQRHKDTPRRMYAAHYR